MGLVLDARCSGRAWLCLALVIESCLSHFAKEPGIKSLLIIVGLLAASFYGTDLSSASALRSLFLPVVNFVLICTLAIWLVQRGAGQKLERSGSDAGFFGDFFDAGGRWGAVISICRLSVVLLWTISVNAAWAQGNAGNFEFRIYEVAGQVHMLEAPGAGGNIAVFSGDDAVLLVDDRFDQDVDALLAAVSQITDQTIDYVINTHIHPDHIGGNNRLAGYGVTILAHDNVRLRMLSELRIPRRGGIYFDQPPAAARPVITYSEGITFHLNGEQVQVFLAPPAHTDGDSFVYFTESDVLHLGDVFRTNMYPIIDHYNGGSFLGMIDAMGLAIGMAGPDTKVIPGHGVGVSDRDGMLEVQQLLFTMRDRVQERIDDGMNLQDIVEDTPFADLDDRWGTVPSWTAEDVIRIIYRELSDD